METSLDGWDIGTGDTIGWVPLGTDGLARAKLLATGGGSYVALIAAEPGYHADPHTHAHAEFLYIVDGTVRNQGRQMRQGDAYAAEAGSTHTDFTTATGATYLAVFTP